jgi:hypothetical protein
LGKKTLQGFVGCGFFALVTGPFYRLTLYSLRVLGVLRGEKTGLEPSAKPRAANALNYLTVTFDITDRPMGLAAWH